MNKLLVGITGGIGSGKSTVARIVKTLGYPVYDADDEAGRILGNDEQVIMAVKNLLGQNAFLPNGSPDRAFISSVVFNSPEKLRELNAIIHPAVRTHFQNWVMNNQAVLLFKEAAIMFESGSYKEMDQIIAVTAPERIRIDRVMARDKKSEQQVLQIINRQLPQSELIERSHFVIVNDDKHMVIPQVLTVIEKLKTGRI